MMKPVPGPGQADDPVESDFDTAVREGIDLTERPKREIGERQTASSRR